MNKKNINIAVADDDSVNLEVVIMCLSKAGYKNIESFYDGDEIWEYLENNADKVDIVILDKMMPIMGGIEVMQRMHKHEILKDIPIIFQTADVEEHKIKQCLDYGAFACVPKPFKDEIFLSHFENALRTINNES